MDIPRIVIAGTNSGCGKTTITTGILAALVKRGITVQPFKVGPDYIDPMFHTFISGRESRNLDGWMLNKEIVAHLFPKSATGTDLALIEGAMGLYDGYGGDSTVGSTSHIAKIVNSPVILVVNGAGVSLSIVPIIKGFLDFDTNVKIKGVILNNVNSEGHFLILKRIIEEHLGIAVVGYLKRIPEFVLPARHLGLVPREEIKDLKERINILTEQIEKTIDIELLIKLAKDTEDFKDYELNFNIAKRNCSFKIGVAKDKAFNFYYKDNLELLEMLGAELIYFSPINDKSLPDGLDGLYFGGGYPEEWAKELKANEAMRESIRNQIITGIPTYAECGGLMYLSESIMNKNGEIFDMVGVIPGKSEMTTSLQHFGYVEIEVTNDNAISKKGYRVRAHEFHYSKTIVDWSVKSCFKVNKNKGNEHISWQCGYKLHNLIAAYPHIHFWSNTGFAERFVNSCINYKAMVNG
jgi:cobyrinic acid a,c-diamide synthase